MNTLLKSESLTMGLAMFSMFFGAGNIIFPLALGQYAGDKNVYAMSGLILSAAIIPILGTVAMILFDGSTGKFFGRLGKAPGFLLSFLIISLLGPFGSAPRCIALSLTTFNGILSHYSFQGVSPSLFNAIACCVIFLFTIRKNHILTLLGWVLTPFLLISLLTIIIIGFMTEAAPQLQAVEEARSQVFIQGLKEGYHTMDLLAAFFFSSILLNKIKGQLDCETASRKTAYNASVIGAVLLSAIYIGFSYLAAFHGSDLNIASKDQLLGAIAMKIAGPHAGVLVCITIILASLTTAIALISAFTDFMETQVFHQKISYKTTLIGSLLLTFAFSSLNFTGISTFLGPILQICYPGLIVLTLLNIAHRLQNFTPIKIPVFFTFGLSTYFYFF